MFSGSPTAEKIYPRSDHRGGRRLHAQKDGKMGVRENPESVRLVHEVIAKTPSPVKSASLVYVEVRITKIFVTSEE